MQAKRYIICERMYLSVARLWARPYNSKALSLLYFLPLAYGVFFAMIYKKNIDKFIHDPDGFWTLSGGKVTLDEEVHVEWQPPKWKWLNTLLFALSLGAAIIAILVSSVIYVQQRENLAPIFLFIQCVFLIVFSARCFALGRNEFKYRGIVYKDGDVAVRYDTFTGEWASMKAEMIKID